MNRAIWIGLAAAVVVVGGVIGYAYLQRGEDDAAQAASPDVAGAGDDDGLIRHPVPEPSPALPPLPLLAASDAEFHQALTTLFAAQPIESFLIPKQIIQKIVVTVNSLDGRIVPMRLWPLAHVPKLPVVQTAADGVTTLSPDNSARYARYVAAVEAVDAAAAARLYLRYYPLFQQAYTELGFPDRYFNDRLIAVLDHLLETPEVTGPIRLRRPKVLYEYEDADLESRSAGQKLLIRMGPQNAAVVKAKLREIREILVQASKPTP